MWCQFFWRKGASYRGGYGYLCKLKPPMCREAGRGCQSRLCVLFCAPVQRFSVENTQTVPNMAAPHLQCFPFVSPASTPDEVGRMSPSGGRTSTMGECTPQLIHCQYTWFLLHQYWRRNILTVSLLPLAQLLRVSVSLSPDPDPADVTSTPSPSVPQPTMLTYGEFGFLHQTTLPTAPPEK